MCLLFFLHKLLTCQVALVNFEPLGSSFDGGNAQQYKIFYAFLAQMVDPSGWILCNVTIHVQVVAYVAMRSRHRSCRSLSKWLSRLYGDAQLARTTSGTFSAHCSAHQTRQPLPMSRQCSRQSLPASIRPTHFKACC